MNVHRSLLCLLLTLLVLPGAFAAEQPWAIHATDELQPSTADGLEEVYVASSLDNLPEANEDMVRWTWWSWSDETGSNWPDDDALYRASSRNLSVEANQTDSTVEMHALPTTSMLEVAGEVKVVSAEDGARMVAFDLEVTPLLNLSNHTILYVVLTEDRAVDQHLRQVNHLVRELRPEVGFSVKANNATSFVSMLPADHLEAAGVDLMEVPTGWSYTVAVFGAGADEDNESRLLWMAHGMLPSTQQDVSATQTWTPLLLTAVAAVIAVSILGALRQREQAIPHLQANWSTEGPLQVQVRIHAGTHPFRITAWTVSEPWQFKGRPSKLELKAGAQMDTTVMFREAMNHDVHIDVAIEIEDFGAWKQHLWLGAPPSEGTNSSQ